MSVTVAEILRLVTFLVIILWMRIGMDILMTMTECFLRCVSHSPFTLFEFKLIMKRYLVWLMLLPLILFPVNLCCIHVSNCGCDCECRHCNCGSCDAYCGHCSVNLFYNCNKYDWSWLFKHPTSLILPPKLHLSLVASSLSFY